MNAVSVGLIYLESVRPGSAAGHHLSGTTARIEADPSLSVTGTASSVAESVIARFASVHLRGLTLLGQADVLVVRFHPLLIALLVLARLRGKPYVLLVQGAPTDILASGGIRRRFGTVFQRMTKWSLTNASGIVAVNPLLAEHLNLEYRIRVDRVIPNGTPIVSGKRAVPRSLPDKYVVFAGAFAEWQGIDVLLDSLDHPEWPKNVHLVMAGSGARRPEVESRAVRGDLCYLGQLDPSELAFVLSDALASLSPKIPTEATVHGISPFKVMESITAGVPVICTDIPGQTELVRGGGVGLVIPPGSAEELARAVGDLAGDDDARLRMVENCYREAHKYAWESGSAELSQVVRAART